MVAWTAVNTPSYELGHGGLRHSFLTPNRDASMAGHLKPEDQQIAAPFPFRKTSGQ